LAEGDEDFILPCQELPLETEYRFGIVFGCSPDGSPVPPEFLQDAAERWLGYHVGWHKRAMACPVWNPMEPIDGSLGLLNFKSPLLWKIAT
jgi:hypothetical protein